MSEEIKDLNLDKARVIRVFGETTPPWRRLMWQVTSPVEVLSEDGSRIGWAAIHPVGAADSACITSALCYDSPERLDIENGQRYYSWIEGYAQIDVLPYEIRGMIHPLGDVTVNIEHLLITGIRLLKRPSFRGQSPIVVIP